MRIGRTLVGTLAVASAVALLAACVPPPPPPPPPVPAEYTTLAQSVSSDMDRWASDLATRQPQGVVPVFGASLLVADGNRGPALLAPGTMGAVDLMLDRLQALGVRGITLQINFPLLNDSFPRAADYLAFYTTVAQHVRARGLTLTVEQHLAFSGTDFSPIPRFDYAGTGYDGFLALFRSMTQKIIDSVAPDYLTILSEPDTFARLSGFTQVQSPAGEAAFVRAALAGIPRHCTKIGAGVGSWLVDSPAYAQAVAAEAVDYVDLHIYPIGSVPLTNAQKIADIARAAGKPVVLDEVWMHKMYPGEGTSGDLATFTEIHRRDLFSFWAPYDSRFLDLVGQFARDNGIAYVAPFWTTQFFAYVDYSATTATAPYPQLASQESQLSFAAMQAGTSTSTGKTYGALAR